MRILGGTWRWTGRLALVALLLFAPPALAARRAARKQTLSIDIGGHGIKLQVIGPRGRLVGPRQTVPTPRGATPQEVVSLLRGLASRAPARFDRVAVGFPGVVKNGVVYTAANINPKAWPGHNLRASLERVLHKEVRVANDAAVAGLAFADESRGKKVLVLTLGTGFGSVLLNDGAATPLELGHHPLGKKGKTYEDLLSNAALESVGRKEWNQRLSDALEQLHRTFNPDLILLGGGNSRHVKPRLLAAVKDHMAVRVVGNDPGILGGPRLFDPQNQTL